ncbi:collagen-like protein [Halopiger goleimassiliensis]|uniref:collagen-like protein n=1 Tax=Halopiger goleimassiliensis TaxID=1293048 RepID=UPI000677B032|nr:collagen-like protein [Halopiger goleimassiliensis]
MIRWKQLAVALSIAMVLTAIAPMGAAAAEPDHEEISLAVSDDGVVSVTADGTPVENATVEVVSDEEYAGTGTYATDADGEVALPAPDETVEVTVTASTTETSVELTTTLEPETVDELSIGVSQNEDVVVSVTDGNESAVANATLDVSDADENATYAETGQYTTDASGTVPLAAPNETVDVTFTASTDDASAETTVTLEGSADEPESFGQLVSSFVQNLETDGPAGLSVSEFVLEHNPGNAPDHAGPPGEDGKQGPPDHAGPSHDDDDQRGPPAHAGPSDDEDDEDEDEEDDDDDDDDDDEDGGGPPDHAGPNR